MVWKTVLSFIFFLVVVVLLGLYWFLPGNIEFSFTPKNTNFTLNSSLNEDMQFYENMRYSGSDISYRIEDCTLKKEDDMLRALQIIEDLTIINFYSVSSNEEIFITCDERAKFGGDLFVAGEGGPINITQSENFNVIHKGAITLIRESKCGKPNVAIHELLHALGFDHSGNPDNIMYEVSKCDQEIGQDTIELIDILYSIPSLPDLAFGNVSASMSGRYLDITFTIRNNGLKDVGSFDVIIYGDGSSLKTVDVDEIKIGHGKIITLRNIFVLKPNINEIQLLIDYKPPELNKDNNEITLEIKK